MKTLLALIIVALLVGCSALPSIQHCDDVEYQRKGRDIHFEADCKAPMGSVVPGL